MAKVFHADRIAWTAYTTWLAISEGRLTHCGEEELRERQSARLRRILHHAARHVPFYRDWFRAAGVGPEDIRSAEDLRRLPLIGKTEYDAAPGRFASSAAAEALALESSGTSGRARRIGYEARALLLALAAGRRQRLVLRSFVGKESGYREAVVHRDGSVSRQLRAWWEAHLWVPGSIELQRRRLSPLLPYSRLLEELDAFRPEVIRGYGSHLGAFFRWVAAGARRLRKPRVVVYGADAMSPADRRLIENDLGIPVVSTYQAVEALRIGFECEHRAGFHLFLDLIDLRLVDDQGRDVPPGAPGEVVISNLTNRAGLLLNYRLGDVARLAGGTCPCGRTGPRLAGLEGRTHDLVRRRDGSRWAAGAVLALLQSVPGVHQLQLVQEDFDRFRLRVVPGPKIAPAPGALQSRMQEIFGPQISLSIELVEAVETGPGGKVKSVICRMEE